MPNALHATRRLDPHEAGVSLTSLLPGWLLEGIALRPCWRDRRRLDLPRDTRCKSSARGPEFRAASPCDRAEPFARNRRAA